MEERLAVSDVAVDELPGFRRDLSELSAEPGRRVSTAGGRNPRWRSDGRELYYAASDGFVMAVPALPVPRLEVGAPTRLFHLETGIDDYDPLPDGTRFLVRTSPEKVRESPIRLVTNWAAGMPR